jgi:hypothetical protein
MNNYVEAYSESLNPILGNMDGQCVYNYRNFRRSNHYKSLVSGNDRPKYIRVKMWRIVTTRGDILAEIFNPHFTATEGL